MKGGRRPSLPQASSSTVGFRFGKPLQIGNEIFNAGWQSMVGFVCCFRESKSSFFHGMFSGDIVWKRMDLGSLKWGISFARFQLKDVII